MQRCHSACVSARSLTDLERRFGTELTILPRLMLLSRTSFPIPTVIWRISTGTGRFSRTQLHPVAPLPSLNQWQTLPA